jgi:adenine-specific DNA-methyltransferase
MKKLTIEGPESKSMDVVHENIAQLRNIFPQAFSEGKVDFGVLKQLLGGAVDDREEKYGLNWNGKRKARLEALRPSTDTLRPAPEESVEWENTQNILIEGDNLKALKLLQKSYANQVKLIYIDPPYNTGRDMVYHDDFHENRAEYKEQLGSLGMQANVEASGRFHTAWLNMMYPRLLLAKNLLRPDGVLFMSIDDNELSNAKALCDEVFGSENYVTVINWKTRGTGGQVKQNALIDQVEYILVYCKSIDTVRINKLPNENVGATKWRDFRKSGGEWQRRHRPEQFFPFYWDEHSERLSMEKFPGAVEVIPADASGEEGFWENGKTTARKRLEAGELRCRYVRDRWKLEQYEVADETTNAGNFIDISSMRGGEEIKALFGQTVFNNAKPLEVIDYVLTLGSDKDSLVLDFFAGSGTTAHCVMAKNAAEEGGGTRRCISVQYPEPLSPDEKSQAEAHKFCKTNKLAPNIASITKERVRRASKKIRAEYPGFKGDLGVRVFKLDSSNLKAWDPETKNVAQSLLDSAEHVKPDRSEVDLLYELLLKKGLDLAVPMEKKVIAKHDVYSIGGGVMLACFTDSITAKNAESLAMGIAAWHKTLTPANDKETVVIFKDAAFDSNVAKSNLSAILSQMGLKNLQSI